MDFLKEWEEKLGVKIVCSQVRSQLVADLSEAPGRVGSSACNRARRSTLQKLGLPRCPAISAA